MILTAYFLLTIAYAVLMIVYRIGWLKQPVFAVNPDFVPSTVITIVIPARNEANNITACIRSILSQDYPESLVEIIVVDDHSEDDTVALAGQYSSRVQVLLLHEHLEATSAVRAYKKMALSAGIAAGRGSLVVTTDADCEASAGWLKHIAALYERSDAAMIIGPVRFRTVSTLVGLFQSIDFTTMQGITAAAHRLRMGAMANGANLAFSRAAFMEVKGYRGIDHLASGDDYLLLHKMQQQFPDRIQYLKSREAIITTAPQPDWRSFLQQRIRWASKSGKYADYRLTAILLLVYLFNVSIALLAILCFLIPGLWFILIGVMAGKTISELVFLIPIWRFYKNGRGLPFFPLLQPLHIAYIIMAGFLGLLGGYQWKGRAVR